MTKIGAGQGLTPQAMVQTSGPVGESEQVASTPQIREALSGRPASAQVAEAFQRQFGPEQAGQAEQPVPTDAALQSELKDAFPGMLKVAPTPPSFGQMKAGQPAHFKTSGGFQVQFSGAESLEIRHPNGHVEQIALGAEAALLQQADGSQRAQPFPFSLVLDDGTKLSFAQGGHAAVIQDREFASIRQGNISTNNRSSLKNKLYQTLSSRGLSLQEVLEDFKTHDSDLHQIAEKYDLRSSDVIDFNSADMDLLFVDGEYLVMGAEGGLVDASAAQGLSDEAQSALQESKMDRSIRQQKFWQSQLSSLIQQMSQIGASWSPF